MGKHNSTRVEEGSAETFSRQTCNVRTVVEGAGGEGLICDPGSMPRLRGDQEKVSEDNTYYCNVGTLVLKMGWTK